MLAARRGPRGGARAAASRVALVTATAAAAVAIAALPGAGEREAAPPTPVGMLRAAAAVAAEQPAPPAFTRLPLHRGARALALGAGRRPEEVEQRARELGRPRAGRATASRTQGKVLAGRAARLLRRRRTSAPFVYGDGPLLRPRHRRAARPSRARCWRALDANNRYAELGTRACRRPARPATTSPAACCCCSAPPTPRRRCASALWGVLALMPGLQARAGRARSARP